MLIVSDRSDPLSYGTNRDCFIQKIDEISISSWGEITTFQYTGLNDFFRCITDLFNNCEHPVDTKQLKINCYTATRGQSILLRADTIFSNLVRFFSTPSATKKNRYILPGEKGYYIFQQKNRTLQFYFLESAEQIMEELATPQETDSTVHFDHGVLENSFIPYLYSLNIANTIQFFYMVENTTVTIYIIDERGALFTQEYKESNDNQVLNQYSEFLESILNHQLYRENIQIKYYEILKNSTGIISVHTAQWTSSPSNLNLTIRIATKGHLADTKAATYYIYCNDIEFNSIEYGNQLFVEISNYILDFRNNNEPYPIHISDIDVPYSYLDADNEAQLQTIHFLKYKRKIEAKLN
jgi:adenylate cyclase class 1